jgi:hypothetical protein
MKYVCLAVVVLALYMIMTSVNGLSAAYSDYVNQDVAIAVTHYYAGVIVGGSILFVGALVGMKHVK